MKATMEQVKALRAKTNAAFSDCKKALDETGGNIEAAEKLLKKMGLAAAARRGGRATGEGSIFAAENETHAVILELRCETDFVARNETFQTLGKTLMTTILGTKTTTLNTELEHSVSEVAGTLKENIVLKRFSLMKKSEREILASYVHGTPARLGAHVFLDVSDAQARTDERVRRLAHNCALHAVARTPLFLSPETVDDTHKNAQMEIFEAQTSELKKPEKVARAIVEGKWRKYLNEICFNLQPWVHDEKSNAHAEIQTVAKELDTKICISRFIVYILGSNDK